MDILHLSDTHLGRAGKPAPGEPSPAERHLWAFEQALELARQDSIKLVVHTGDVFHRSRPPARAMAQAARLLRELAARVPVVVLAGNHDRHGIVRSLPMDVPGLHLIQGAASLRVAGLRLACVNYQRSAAGWAEAARRAWGGGADLLLCHQAVHGAVVSLRRAQVPGLFTFSVGAQRDTIGEQHLPPGVRWILCGHIHPRQAVALGGATVVHPGATFATSQAEAGQPKGVVRWSLGRTVEWRYMDLPQQDRGWRRELRVVGRERQLGLGW